ncbi:MAG TPA: 6-bladed beta-propeller [Solirubrobacteraceae bacterium]|nr:6-bladed beta-propeller [Solirubrobacteraceae bacterium]
MLALLLPPSARDASGMQVPLAVSVRGDVIGIEVLGSWDDYRLPIAVDPELVTTEDRSLTGAVFPVEPYKGGTNWLEFHSGAFSAKTYTKYYSCGTERYWCEQSWSIEPVASYVAKEVVGLQYETQGESRVYKLEAWMKGDNEPSETSTGIEFDGHEGVGQTNYAPIAYGSHQSEYSYEPALVCSNGAGCKPSEAPEGNVARIIDTTTKSEGDYGFWMYVWDARAWVAQEKSPEASYNTTSPTITEAANRANVLYGSGSWLSPSQGAYEIKTHDPGIGVSLAAVSGAGLSDEKFIRNEEGACQGIQCSETYNKALTYLPSMANGEDSIKLSAENAAGMVGEEYATIKVDAAKPYNVQVKGMAEEGAEISAAPHILTFEATDGTKPTPSSGIKSITVSIDGGQPSEVPGASCAPGECTGKGEWTLHAEDLSEGEHEITITATDNAGNSQPRRVFFDVRHAAPVALGPGSVDPTTGQFTLNATDVSLSGVSGVSRTYQSRNLTGGAEGPLGPQWTINSGAGEGLSVLSTGEVELEAAGGTLTSFSRNTKGEYESPQGDSNLKVESKEKVPGKGITEYIVRDSSGGTATHYTQPVGERPSFSTQFGAEVAGELKEPIGEALDSSGNLWVTDFANSRIEKFSPTGLLQAAYGSYGSEPGQFEHPWGIAVNQSNGDVYVTDQGNYRVDEFSSTGKFIMSFGEKGTSPGQFGILAGVAVDSSGNVWVADYGNNRIEEFNETGVFQKAFGSEGSGPSNIAFSGGYMYVTDYASNHVAKFSMAGKYESQFGKAGSGNGEFKGPYGIATEPATGNLYVVDNGNKRVEEFSAAGSFITKFGASGTGSEQFSGPAGIAVSTAGNIYVADAAGSRVEEWARSQWLPSIGEGPIPSARTTYAYQTAEVGEEVVLEPSEALAPAPPGVSCAPKLEKGCRALTFNYATSTTATGENESQWGDYKGRLTRVYFTAWNSSKGEMTETTVAQYAYDSKGRLRAEWDPRISPALKTIYGYDAEGHVTAVTRAGQQPWVITYGTTAGDPSLGRVISVTRPSARTTLGSGEAPQVTTEPSLSTTKPKVGEAVTVNKGTWSNSPLSYSYQWERCWSETVGESLVYRCAPIEGAVNATYTPLSRDRGKKLLVTVTATNAAGSTASCTANLAGKCNFAGGPEVGGTGELSEEPIPSPPTVGESSVWTVEYGVPTSGSRAPYNLEGEAWKWGQTKDLPVEGMAIFPPDEPQGWPAGSYKRATIQYLDAEGRTVNAAAPTGGIATTEYNELNEPDRTLSADNRAAALKESCESKEHCKSAETAAKLEAKSTYNPGGQLIETLGPEHKVKLASGSEVLARNHMVYHYNEGAPETGEGYSLVTKTTDGAQYEGKEADVRTTVTSYSGQKELGWTLRKPTSVTTDATGLDLTTTTEYNETTGNVIATKSPAGTSQAVAPLAFSTAFGGKGSGGGQFSEPMGVAVDATGDVWVTDQTNNRVEKFTPAGSFIAAYGSTGSGELEFSNPAGIAVNQSTGNVYVCDLSNSRVEELNSSGGFVRTFGSSGEGKLEQPSGVTIDANGNVWVLDLAADRVEEFSATGTYIKGFASKGSGPGQLDSPTSLTIAEGDIYVVDAGNSRVEEFSTSGTYLGQFGSEGSGEGQFKEPFGIGVNTTTGDLYVSDSNNSRIEEFTPAGKFLTTFGLYGSTNGRFNEPRGVALNSTGALYAVDFANYRVQEWLPPETGGGHMAYSTQFGSYGSGEGQFYYPTGVAFDGHGNVWADDENNHRVEELSAQGKFIAAYGSYGTGNREFGHPTGIDVNQSTGNVYIADCEDNRIQELSSKGAFIRTFGKYGTKPGELDCPNGLKIDPSGNVWVADTKNNRIEEFSSTGSFIAAYGSEGSGNGQFKEPTGLTIAGGNIYVVDTGNTRVQELSTTGTYIRQFGSQGSGGGEFWNPNGIAANSAGDLYVVDIGDSRIEEFSSAGGYLGTFGSAGSGEGQLHYPQDIALNAAGDVYVSDTGDNRIEVWAPNNQAVHDIKTIYYTAKEEAETSTCRNHPEWDGLPCQTTPAAQPESGLPELPVKTYTYNIWDEVETTTEVVTSKTGSTTRTIKETYDGAGRALTSETSSTVDTALPKVTNEYSTETGALLKQSATIKGATKTISSKYNTLGQLTEYTDAEGSTTKYTYDVDGRPTEVSYELPGKATDSQVYSYDPTSGLMTELHDTVPGASMTFTAAYDVEGKLTSEGYPNGMSAGYTISPAGQATSVEYLKLTHCTEKCTWFSDSIAPSIHGETLSQTSTLASENYSYDTAGRLTQTQETLAGKGCTTRIYAYNEDSDRTSLTTVQPGSEGQCESEGGSAERHVYDPADRLADEGVAYETFGNATTMPAADAGGHELAGSYYVDGQLATEKQNGETMNYLYDPAGRTLETVAEGTTSATTIDHYAGPGEAVSWVGEGGEKWTRNVPGIDGTLAAVQKSGQAPVLQLHDLQGNVVATAALSETETKLLSTYNSTEFGVPQPGTTPLKYAWLGADGLASEPAFGSGVTFQGGKSYVPQVAENLQSYPVIPPGAFPNGLGPATPYTAHVSSAAFASAEAQATKNYDETEAARQEAKRKEEEALIAELGVGAEDPKRSYFLLDPQEAKELSEDISTLGTRSKLIGLALSIVPAIGDAAGIAGETYAAYLELWASHFDSLYESMEKEANSTKRYTDVYRVTEYYAAIPLLGNFPETFGPIEQCVFIEFDHGNTRYECASGEWEVQGKHY